MIWDVVIIGAGPAGTAAAIYSARQKLNVLVISKDVGGQVAAVDRQARVAGQACSYSYKAAFLVVFHIPFVVWRLGRILFHFMRLLFCGEGGTELAM